MAYKNQQDFIDKLESAGELIRIEAYVNPNWRWPRLPTA
jgi:3-polyprenyl-4-hydroxybenzoate decarboxylase